MKIINLDKKSNTIIMVTVGGQQIALSVSQIRQFAKSMVPGPDKGSEPMAALSPDKDEEAYEAEKRREGSSLASLGKGLSWLAKDVGNESMALEVETVEARLDGYLKVFDGRTPKVYKGTVCKAFITILERFPSLQNQIGKFLITYPGLIVAADQRRLKELLNMRLTTELHSNESA